MRRDFLVSDELLKNRIVFISGKIDSNCAKDVVSRLLYLDSLGHDDIVLYINSPGGQVSSGMMIYDTMRYISSDVVTVGVGLCASMASILLMAGCEGKRKILPHAEVMLHQPLGATEGQASDIIVAADHIKKIKDMINDIIFKHTKLSKVEINDNIERDFWISSVDALKFGIVDDIIDAN